MSDNAPSENWLFVAETEDRLADLAGALAPGLKAGDTIALIGDLGAGKTAFARALIRILGDEPDLEVPSPTFNLVQTYETPSGTVAHFDLYRLEHPHELEELDWYETLLQAITLIEWPDRADALPNDRLDVEIVPVGDGETREFCLTGQGAMAPRLARLRDIAAFLNAAGWSQASRRHLHGDASYRSYERLTRSGATAILMNAPPRPDGPAIRNGRSYSAIAKLAENMVPFVAIAEGLRKNGFHSPAIFASEAEAGLILLEDFGSETIVSGVPPLPVAERYAVAVDVLASIHQTTWPQTVALPDTRQYTLPNFDEEAFLIEVELLLDWFAPAVNGQDNGAPAETSDREAFLKIWKHLFPAVEPEIPVWVLRDFHSPNLHWLAGETGLARIGLIDFQDARVDISPDLEADLYQQYIGRMKGRPGFDETDFARAYAIFGAQRASKILGIFVRLARRDGKTAYLRHLPRIAGYLARNLAHPVLADLKRWLAANVPEALDPPPALDENRTAS